MKLQHISEMRFLQKPTSVATTDKSSAWYKKAIAKKAKETTEFNNAVTGIDKFNLLRKKFQDGTLMGTVTIIVQGWPQQVLTAQRKRTPNSAISAYDETTKIISFDNHLGSGGAKKHLITYTVNIGDLQFIKRQYSGISRTAYEYIFETKNVPEKKGWTNPHFEKLKQKRMQKESYRLTLTEYSSSGITDLAKYAKPATIDDLTPYEDIEKIKKLIRKGAHDPDHNWVNALDLLHQAYKAVNVQRPQPAQEGAWKQYEDCILFAVHELNDATHKGIRDDSWKTLSSTIDGTWTRK